jgi:uncharacterized protein (TIGR03086 family)
MAPPISATIRAMSDIPPVVADSDRLVDTVQRLVDRVRPDQWTAPTPCSEWNVRQLLHHLTNGNVLFAMLATGERSAGPITAEERAADWLGDDPAAGFRAAGKRMHDAFLTPGFLEGKFDAPYTGEASGMTIVHMRMNEQLIHGWDLARGTGQPADFPEDLAEEALRFWQSGLGDRPRTGMPFGEPVHLPDTAPAIDRLAAFLGRQP